MGPDWPTAIRGQGAEKGGQFPETLEFVKMEHMEQKVGVLPHNSGP